MTNEELLLEYDYTYSATREHPKRRQLRAELLRRLGAAVSASPQPSVDIKQKCINFICQYPYPTWEQLVVLIESCFAAAPAQEPRKMIPHKGKESVCSHCGVKIYQAINKLWLTPFTQFRHCAGTANRNHEPTEPSAAAKLKC